VDEEQGSTTEHSKTGCTGKGATNEQANRATKTASFKNFRGIKSMNYEQGIIGSLLINPLAIEGLKPIVSPSDFGNDQLGEVLRAIYELSDSGKPVDTLSLGDELSNDKYLTTLTLNDLLAIEENTASAANVEYYAERVRDNAKRRAVQRVSECANDAESGAEAVDEALKRLLAINTEQKKNQKHVNDALNEVIKRTEEIFNGNINYIKTGLIDLDQQINGFSGGRLYLLGARPAMGKSALALNFALDAIKNNIPTMIFSLEMPSDEVTYRMICAAANLNTRAQNNMQDEDWAKITAGFNILKDKPLIIDDSAGYSLSYLKNAIRTHASKHDQSFYVVDYLQLIRVKGDNRVQGIGEISRELKLLSKDIDRPILLLSQLNRSLEQRPDKRPTMADLRESGELEQDADVIMFIYRDEVYNEDTEAKGIAEILVRKNRQGETGKVLVKSQLEYAKFSDLSLNRNYRDFGS